MYICYTQSMRHSTKTKEKLIIPGIGEIPVFQGAVPSTGGTASIEIIAREFAKAAKEKVIPPPIDFTLNTE